jgi:hypothetical protein
MAYVRENALRLVLGAIRPHLDDAGINDSTKSFDQAIAEGLKAMNEEPHFGAAFDAAVKVVWDTATYYATPGHTK